MKKNTSAPSAMADTNQKQKPGLAARAAVTLIMTRILDDGRGLDGLLDSRHGPAAFHRLDQADKGLVRAIVTTAVRHRGEIDYALSKVLDRKLPKNARHLLHTLHGAAAQILFMDVPDSAAVDLAVTILRQDKRSQRFANLGNALLRRIAREKEQIFDGQEQLAELNMPAWFRKRIKKAYGRTRLKSIAEQHMLEPVIDLCVKSNPEQWAKELGGVHLFGHSIRVLAEGKISDWPGYEDGQWWVQDAAATLPVHMLGDIKGKNVLDLCAAPGGKTAQLAQAGAKVTALEASKDRLIRLQENLTRLQFADVNCIHADMMEWQTEHLFDAVLLDAPCSSTGTIRRHPDVQWTKSLEQIESLAELQHKMLLEAARFVKPDGLLVFANCSLDRAEGEDVYAAVLQQSTTLIAEPVSPEQLFNMQECITGQGTVRSLPCHLQEIKADFSEIKKAQRFTGLDGFFAARFKRNTVSF